MSIVALNIQIKKFQEEMKTTNESIINERVDQGQYDWHYEGNQNFRIINAWNY